MQPCGLKECADKRVVHGGTLVKKSGGGAQNPSPPSTLGILIGLVAANPARHTITLIITGAVQSKSNRT